MSNATQCEMGVIDWMAASDFEVLSDSVVFKTRLFHVDVILDDGEFRIINYTTDSARLIRYSVTFSVGAPSSAVIAAINTLLNDKACCECNYTDSFCPIHH